MRIYTKSGDEGSTGLLFGGRVSKSDGRCEAYGAIDQAVSAMGLARALCKNEDVSGILMRLQRELFIVGGELATSVDNYHHLVETFSIVTDVMVEQLEEIIDDLSSQTPLVAEFVLPGGSPGSGALDLARAIVRTGERRITELKEEGNLVNPAVLCYINRLSDLLFVLARYEDRDAPVETVNQK